MKFKMEISRIGITRLEATVTTLDTIVAKFRQKSPNIALAFDEVQRRLTVLEGGSTPPPPPPPGGFPHSGAYFSENFSTWSYDDQTDWWLVAGDRSLFSLIPNGLDGKALRLLAPGGSGGNGVLASGFIGAQSARGGYRVTGQSGVREETWFRVRVRFPKGIWVPMAGDGRWTVEHHTMLTSRFSIALGQRADGYPGQVGTNPRWLWQLTGGPATGSGQGATTDEQIECGPIVTDHWYDILEHYIFDGVNGLAELYIDGVQVARRVRPTLPIHPDGRWDYLAYGLYNYANAAMPVDTSIDFDLVEFGPTRASVGG